MKCINMNENKKEKSSLRKRADAIKDYRCKYLIAVLEYPTDFVNIGTVIRNVNTLWVEKLYIVDPKNQLPDDWQDMRERKSLNASSVSAIKWSFVKRFDSTDDCFDHLEKNWFVSIVTSPHVKWKKNVVLHEWEYTQWKLAIWFWNESRWISDRAVERSEMCINIPMYGIIESLNLATCSWIVLYEITKQRREFRKNKKKKVSEG